MSETTDFNIVPATKLNTNNVVFSDLKTEQGKRVFLNYMKSSDKDPGMFRIQLPKMYARFIKMQMKNKDGSPKGEPSYYIEFSFRNKDSNKAVKQVYNNMMALQKLVMKKILDHFEEWDVNDKAKNPTMETVNMFFRPIVKENIDKKTKKQYPETMRGKLKVDNENGFKVEVYDKDGNELDLSEKSLGDRMQGQCQVRAILQCTGIYFIESDIGVAFTLTTLQLFPGQSAVKGFAFQPDSDDEFESGDEEVNSEENSGEYESDDETEEE